MNGVDGYPNWGVTGKVFPPRRRRGQVSRGPLIDQIVAHDPDLVLVIAAAGYGKSTLLAQLTTNDRRRTSWLTIDGTHDEPAALLGDIALALDRIEPIDPRLVDRIRDGSLAMGPAALAEFERTLRTRRGEFLLVLDDVHRLTNPDSLDIVTSVIDELPEGSTLALGSRTHLALPLGRIRSQRQVSEVSEHELALGLSDALEMFQALAVEASVEDVEQLVEHTEGWPLAIYLAALGRTRRPGGAARTTVTGDTRLMVEYFSEVVLAGLEDEVASFLLHVAPLDRFSGRLCDHLLDRRGSAELLEQLHRRNLLVIALDERRQWYRLHHLLAEYLTAELERRDPGAAASLLAQASVWHEQHGDAEESITYAWRSGDVARATALVVDHFPHYASRGRHATVERWVGLFGSQQLESQPLLLSMMPLAPFLLGESRSARRWLDHAVGVIGLDMPADVAGFDEHVCVALLRAGMEWLPATEAARGARYAYERVERSASWHPLACLVLGATEAMAGRYETALTVLREGTEGTESRLLNYVNSAGILSILLAERGEWDEAVEIALRARALLGDRSSLPSTAVALAASTMAFTRQGNSERAAAEQRLARSHLTHYASFCPLVNHFTRLGLARSSMLADRTVEAGALLDELDVLFASTAGVGVSEQVGKLRGELSRRRGDGTGFGPGSLTTAEMRVLQFLPTHLTVGEIAERLHLSPNTVKTHTITIYRKLGTSSRGGAVELARTAGLVS